MTLSYAIQSRRPPLQNIGLRLLIVLLLVGFSAIAFYYGHTFRRYVWDQTEEMRYTGDVTCGFGWGQQANRFGLTNIYDLYSAGRISGPNALDYTPLRLTVVSLWARWAATHFPQVRGWRNDYDLTRPMLMANMTAELISSILIFLLIRMWIIRMDNARRPLGSEPPPFRGVVRGMIGALFFWFNPAVIWDGHAFPQWDVWNAPFFLAAALLASGNLWFAAGLAVVTGAFFKGQILLVAPLFLIWPIVQLRFGAMIRFICGFLVGGAMLALPWFNAQPTAIIWYGLVLLSMTLLCPFVLRWNLRNRWLILLVVVALALAWPWTSKASPALRIVSLALVGGVAMLRFAPPRMLPSLYALAGSIAILMTIPLYNANTAWFSQGFEFGTQKLMWMATDGTYSLPGFLVDRYGWSNNPNVPVPLPAGLSFLGETIPFRRLMFTIYGTCLALCGLGAAMHERRSDPRFLVALVTPWLCWFAVLTQLNNRYLIWAAGFSGLLVGVSWGMTLLGVMTSIIGWLAINDILHWSGGNPQTTRMLNAINSQMIWPILLLAAIYLYIAVAPRRKYPLDSRTDF